MGYTAVLGGRGANLALLCREAFLYLPVWATSQKAKAEGREYGQRMLSSLYQQCGNGAWQLPGVN